jgi:hypothetical protein
MRPLVGTHVTLNVHPGEHGEVELVYSGDAADGVLTADARRPCSGVLLHAFTERSRQIRRVDVRRRHFPRRP